MKEFVKPVVRHSILTSFALDAVGFALASQPLEDRLKWLNGKKDTLPRHYNNTLFNGRTSFNSKFFLFVFKLLADINPVMLQDIGMVVSELKSKIRTYGKESKRDRIIVPNRLATENQGSDTGLVLSVALAVGYYAALVGADLFFFFSLEEAVLDCFDFGDDARDAGELLSYTVYRLIAAGYFSTPHLEEADAYGMIPESMQEYVALLIAKDLDTDFLGADFDRTLTEEMSYSQKVIAEVFFYLMRVNTGFTRKVNSAPRAQLRELFTSTHADSEDLGFVFGAVATASEHLHPVVKRRFRETSEHRRSLDESLRFA